jgi:hypothetical protein
MTFSARLATQILRSSKVRAPAAVMVMVSTQARITIVLAAAADVDGSPG